MERIVVVTGQINSNFFTNEIEYIKKNFGSVKVIAYKETKNECQAVIDKHELDVVFIGKKIRTLFSKRFWMWLFDKSTISEIKKNMHGRKPLQRILYVLHYGVYCSEVYTEIEKFLRDSDADDEVYLYAYWMSRPAYAISYYKMCNKDDARIRNVFSRAHGYDLYTERNGTDYLPFRKLVNTYLDNIYFISKNGKDYFQRKYDFASTGACKSVCKLGCYNPKTVRKKIEKKDFVCIVSCSAIVQVKRLDLIIDTISKLKTRVKWVHIGDGPLEKEIEELAKKRLCNVECTFVGRVDNSAIYDYYEKYDADYFINMSDSEGIPVSIMEAMSHGLPCIGRNVGGMEELINEANGLLLEEHQKEEWICAIDDFLDIRLRDISKYSKISQACIRMWNEEYNAANNYGVFFGNVIKEKAEKTKENNE